jgi:hypothetical protein
MAKNMLDFITQMAEREERKANGETITYDEWCEIRRTGTPEEIEEAVERMMAAGGYDNLE